MREPGNGAWWQGRRGEWYAVLQVLLLTLVFLGPRTLAGWPAWPAWLLAPARAVGIVLMAAGFVLLVAGGLKLGMPDLTPLPCPRPGGVLRDDGAYGVVRHPMYCGGIFVSFGWALAVHGWLTLLYGTAVLLFAEVKASREERWLLATYPDYAAYRQRVRKLIPFVH